MLSNLRIGPRLAWGFGSLLVLLMCMGGLAAMQTSVINDALEYYTGNTTPSLQAVKGWQDQIAAIRMLQARHIMSNDQADMKSAEDGIDNATSELKREIAAYAPLISDDRERRIWQDVDKATTALVAGWEPLKAISRQTAADPAKLDEARRMFVGPTEALHQAASAAIDKAWRFNTDMATQLAAQGDRTYHHALAFIGVACGLAAAVGLVAALAITRSVTRPIQEAVKVAETVANRDLTSLIHPQGKDECAQLLTALKRMNDNLVTVIAEVRHSSDSVATGSGEIAMGNADLSQRTEEQASNLQQTAASMEQLASTVRSNAEITAQANALATEASASAARGGEVVDQVVATMQGISDASRKIADIIGVIDGIAFQTNILALNAAVEAARAGEQGRGFAVVASEVRSLAQRSAGAAKEIKTLIGDSVDKVEAGSRQVGDAGRAMEGIVAHVKRVGQLIGEVSHATAEQSSGIGQVSDAVGQLDQVTQQNAALVEESAAAADSLKHQAMRLSELVSSFKLDQARLNA